MWPVSGNSLFCQLTYICSFNAAALFASWPLGSAISLYVSEALADETSPHFSVEVFLYYVGSGVKMSILIGILQFNHHCGL